MSIRSFSKTRLALSAVLAVGGLYVVILLASLSLASWAERDLNAFPFKSEDWLRYLLASGFEDQDRGRIFLTGPSTVRENFLYERFEEAFPGRQVFQGGISLGTLEDATVALEYLDAVHGAAARMDLIVVGISPRFVANIPDERPFKDGLDNYSPYFSTRQEEVGIALVPKGALEGLVARARFLAVKQPARLRTALLALANHWISGENSVLRDLVDRIFRNPLAATVARLVGFWQIKSYDFSELLEFQISPYKYALNETIEYPVDWIQNYDPKTDGWWGKTYTWDPRKDQEAVRTRLRKISDYARERNTALLFVNLPERDFSRNRFDEGNYQAYLDLVRSSIGGASFVNLRDFLVTEEYHDREHSLPPGSLRLTNEVIEHARSALRRDHAAN